MVVLDWRDAAVEMVFQNNAENMLPTLELFLTEAQNQELCVAFKIDEELKLELPQRWTLYFKFKEGSKAPNKISLAKPSLNTYVASLIINDSQSEFLFSNLKNLLSSSHIIQFSKLGTTSSINNFDLILRAKWK